MDQLAEVLVGVEEHGAGPLRLVEHGVVRHPGRQLRHVRDLVPVVTQTFDDLPIDALVGQDDQRVPSPIG